MEINKRVKVFLKKLKGSTPDMLRHIAAQIGADPEHYPTDPDQSTEAVEYMEALRCELRARAIDLDGGANGS